MKGLFILLWVWGLMWFLGLNVWLLVRGRGFSFKFSLFFFKILLFFFLSFGCFYLGCLSLEFYFSFLLIMSGGFILVFLEGTGIVG